MNSQECITTFECSTVVGGQWLVVACRCRKRYGLGEFLPLSLVSCGETSRSGRLMLSDVTSARTLRRHLSRHIDDTMSRHIDDTMRARNKAGKPLSCLSADDESQEQGGKTAHLSVCRRWEPGTRRENHSPVCRWSCSTFASSHNCLHTAPDISLWVRLVSSINTRHWHTALIHWVCNSAQNDSLWLAVLNFKKSVTFVFCKFVKFC